MVPSSAEKLPASVALLGLGLMGGSLGLALRSRGFQGPIRGYARRAETRAEALRRGVVDEAFDQPAAAARGVELAVVCVPVLEIPALAAAAAPALAPGGAITDVGSTKAWVVASAREALGAAAARFVGGHPIAGSERQGLAAASADLYAGAVVVLTSTDDTPPDAAARVRALWRFVGAVIIELSPEEHDILLARSSHLPHLAAAALAAVTGRDGGAARVGPFCGPGFRDTTRVADGSPEVWHDIVRTNRNALLAEVEALARELGDLAEILRRENYDALRRWLESARSARRALLEAGAKDRKTGA